MAASRDKLSPYIATSVVLHAMLFAGVVFGPLLFPTRASSSWGTSPDKGVKVGVMASLPGIPLPSPPVVQEDAKGNESKTVNPAETAPKEQKQVPEKVADIKVPSGKKSETKKSEAKRDPEPTRVARTAPPEPTVSNAIPGAASGQVALPYGGVGPATGAPATFGDGSFGTRFPEYVANMTRAIQLHWQNNPLLATRGSSPRVYVKFTIGRRGDVSNIAIDQPSGLEQLDNSARTAVARASLPPLPPGYTGSSVDVRFYFEYSH